MWVLTCRKRSILSPHLARDIDYIKAKTIIAIILVVGRYGSWGCCFTYGTWFGIEGLVMAGEPTDSPAVNKCVTVLLCTDFRLDLNTKTMIVYRYLCGKYEYKVDCNQRNASVCALVPSPHNYYRYWLIYFFSGRAVAFIEKHQRQNGGWGEDFTSCYNKDISANGMQVDGEISRQGSVTRLVVKGRWRD